MAKKKNPNRKHKFKYAEPVLPTAVVGSTARSATVAQASVGAGLVGAANPTGQAYGYVARDVRRLGILALVLVLLELGLWYILGHTSAGQSVYSLIRL